MGKNNQAKRKAKKKLRVLKERRRESRLAVAGKPRPCDGCTVCCTVFGVEEIEKDAWTSCENLCEAGCAIYEDRPKYCGTFHCLWQMGLGTMDQRPDKLGVVFAPTKGKTQVTGESEIQAYEVEPGNFDLPEVVTLVQKCADNGALIIGHVHGSLKKKRLMGSPEKMAKAQALFREKGRLG